MNKFSALSFYLTGNSLGLMRGMADNLRKHETWPEDGVKILKEAAEQASSECGNIGLRLSAKALQRFASEISENWSGDTLRARVEAVKNSIQDELEDHLFLWVPSHRAAFFSRSAESLVGEECCARFPSIRREIEEAIKCYALGRYTACAFHVSRSTEAGMQALARAIHYAPPNNNWNLVFRELGNQFKLPPEKRPQHWQTHGDFLETTWADLRAVGKAWRNDIAHLVDTYIEEEAKDFIAIVPIFLRDLAKKMDESGTLY